MAYTILHTDIGAPAPDWYQVERWSEGKRDAAIRRASQFATDNGGYVCVKDNDGHVVFGTDPVQLNRSILSGQNRYFLNASA